MPNRGLRFSCASSLSRKRRKRRSCGDSALAAVAAGGAASGNAAGAAAAQAESATTADDRAKASFIFITDYPLDVARSRPPLNGWQKGRRGLPQRPFD